MNGERTDVMLSADDPDLATQVARAVEGLHAYAALGVTHMKVSIRAERGAALLEMLDVYGREVLPAYR